MTRRSRWLILLGLAAYLAFAIALLPARFVLAHAAGWLPAHVSITDVSGTLWQGTARELRFRGVAAGPLHWDIQALALFTGALQADIQTKLPQGFVNLTARVSPSGTLELSNLQLAMPLATAAQLAGQPAGLAQGDLSLTLDSLLLENQQPTAARGSLLLGNLRIGLLGDESLGAYQAEIRTTADGIVATATDQSGPLRLQAQANLNPQGGWQATGSIGVRDAGNTRLAELLRYLGPADTSGMHRFSLSGQLP